MDKTHLIGPAATVDGILALMADDLRHDPHANVKTLLYGAPGVGKTQICERLALNLTGGSPFACESINGKELDLAKVKEWRHAMRYGNIFSEWDVKIINEVDKASTDAQVLMLTLLDELPPRRAILTTSNLELKNLSERFQTRFMQYAVDAPATEDIVSLLAQRFPGLHDTEYTAIAVGSGGNVRAALADARAAHLAMRHAKSQPVVATTGDEEDFWK